LLYTNWDAIITTLVSFQPTNFCNPMYNALYHNEAHGSGDVVDNEQNQLLSENQRPTPRYAEDATLLENATFA